MSARYASFVHNASVLIKAFKITGPGAKNNLIYFLSTNTCNITSANQRTCFVCSNRSVYSAPISFYNASNSHWFCLMRNYKSLQFLHSNKALDATRSSGYRKQRLIFTSGLSCLDEVWVDQDGYRQCC